MVATLNVLVHKIASECGEVTGTIRVNKNNIIELSIPNEYCNWMAIGNLFQSTALTLESLNIDKMAFTGEYKISFYGSGNAKE